MTATDRADAVLGALRAAGGDAVSGEALAAALGVSRVAVGKRVAALRELGYTIEASPGLGYRLLASPDRPLPAEVRPLLRSALWTRVTGGGATGSTNDDAKGLARAGTPEGTVVLASEQTGGRGRLGRAWMSPAGGVYFSAVLRPAVAPAVVPPLALVTGVGLARGLATLGADVALKWPNDVYLGGGKLAGILLEMSAEAERAEWVVIGCGINVRRPARSAEGAAYLEDAVSWGASATTGRAPATAAAEDDSAPAPAAPGLLPTVAAAALDGIASAYADFLAGGFAAVRDEYAARAWLHGRDVVVRDANGQVRAAGRAAGVDEAGRLIIEGAGGTLAVASGEVTLRPEGGA